MSQISTDFDEFLKQRKEASDAFVNGESNSLDNISVQISPATSFGPKGNWVQGADLVNAANANGSKHFKSSSKNAFEVLNKGEDKNLAYCIGIQHSVVLMAGHKESIPFDLRVTEIFRRENGAWKLFHRHADPLKSEGVA